MASTVNTGNAALIVRDIHKHYGSGKNKLSVLDGLNMTVHQGSIYGLLGASGCGKTTLLRCCLGRLRFESGNILICGKPPLTRGHGVPGPMVGYMPQETALYSEFTINETLTYFGTLCKMSKESLHTRKQFLLELLHLPEPKSLISNLSGGQKRRVSFAVALLHSPELLILDEPTVGVDPMLRMRIWEHLINLTREGKATVIITTHYIEEARQADCVGLMRSGKLLSESPPQDLMSYHQMQTLEGVFLKLCMKESTSNEEVATFSSHHTSMNVQGDGELHFDEMIKENTTDTSRLIPDDSKPTVSFKQSCSKLEFLPSSSNIAAMMFKSFIRLIRNPGSIVFSFLIPVVEVCLFCLCIGNPPAGLHMAVVNLDTSPLNYSQRFLWHLDNKTIIQHPYDNFTSAFEDARNGKYWGTIYMAPTYSTDLVKRFLEGTKVDNETIEGSTIHVQLDLTNQQIALSLEQTLSLAYQQFITDLLSSIKVPKINPEIAQLPLQFGSPIYGTQDSDFTDFMAPGVILSIIFFLAVALTSLTFVMDRKEGLLERTWVAGASATEVMVAHVAVQFVIMSVQTTVVLIFILLVFDVPNEGSLFLVILLTLLQGLIGMAFGLMVSSVCDSEISAMQFSLGSFYPLILLSGIIWPLEGIPYPLRYFSQIMPQTYAIECLRSVLGRGWSLNFFDVYMGFVTSFAWAFVLLSLSALMIHLRR
ncbi:ABC transporter G family member 20-like [Anneissia japonica]|uniref:ABC transporter G family member 20-like n=1 Tax=Anneissia japonica TaxID=1529436 RepID=UPI0014256A85|nr:ABC transporter G family member 20-like [Anneissia japonica]XP_033125368.1 ABC transporter G family member 20-like [Anneissia japonica]XP_033125369.1 ABC transporter G family member 20-like [Anneissia japonica]XP_033125370.1 ABC transporter G family member 20-like [Anneissia japonica]